MVRSIGRDLATRGLPMLSFVEQQHFRTLVVTEKAKQFETTLAQRLVCLPSQGLSALCFRLPPPLASNSGRGQFALAMMWLGGGYSPSYAKGITDAS